jgi:hypothetical protein
MANESSGGPSLLEATHQLTRLKRAALAGACGFVLASVSSYLALRGNMPLAVTMFSVGLALLCVALWACFRTVRCPNCGDRWLATAMRTRASDNWLQWLLSLDACPRCGKVAASLHADGR